MFTGIIEELGRVRRVEPRGERGVRITIDADVVLTDADIGDSIAVNGCCLTVVDHGPGFWTADAQVETVDRSTIGTLEVGERVNLERPLRIGDRLGGHIVQGHVDGIGTVAGRDVLDDGSTRFRIDAPASILRYVVEKGSVTVDGISLTVTDVDAIGFGTAIIPHTLEATVLGDRGIDDPVNLEIDVLAKYVERLMPPHLVPDRSP